MKRFGIVLLIVLAMGAAGCSRTKVVPQNEAHMSGNSFLEASVTVKAGQPVKFINNPNTATHVLVVGSNGIWAADPNAPAKLNVQSGMDITAGTEIDVVFPTAGTFTVTCTVHPTMLLTVKVTP